MRALLLAALAALPNLPNPFAEKEVNPIVSKQKEKEETITRLKRDIFKVDRSIGETEKLISKSRNAPYLPDLEFRLAELYVEKSRYIYYLQAEQRPPDQKGAMVSPETQLFKGQAVQMYNRILKEFPDFKDGDKVTFYLAHEQRELGQFDDMLKTLGELIRKYPSSPLRLDSEQILGDYFFDKNDLGEAEKHYKAILDAPASPVHDLARYKMGWIRINQSNHAEAVTFFEAAAASAPIPGVDTQKALNVKREALLDLVYSYTEARKPQGALQYFEKLSESRATYALALDKLGNRYFIKQQYEYAIPALRRLMEIQPEPELDLERAEKLYDSLKASKGKVVATAVDIGFLVRAAVQVKTDPAKDDVTRKKQLFELEEMARDLSTQLHLNAQKKDDRQHYVDAADAYKVYLSLFRPKQYVGQIMKNRADALFAAHEFIDAGRQFEELAQYQDGKDPKAHEDALYGALLSYYSALKPGDVEQLNAFEVSDARQAIKLLGATYVGRYAKSEHVTEIKFNIARAYYEDGEYDKSAELFKKFALEHPDHKDAVIAANLGMDSLRQSKDFTGIKTAGKEYLAQGKLPQTFLAEVPKMIEEADKQALVTTIITVSNEGQDIIAGLKIVADQNKGTPVGEQAVWNGFAACRDKGDLAGEKEWGQRLLTEYPKSKFAAGVIDTLGRQAAQSGKFAEAAGFFEQLGTRQAGDASATDGWMSAARLKIALGDYAGAIKDLETAMDGAGGKRVELLVMVGTTRLKMKEPAKAKAAAEAALKLDKSNPGAAAILAEVLAGENGKPEQLAPVLQAVTSRPDAATEETAKALWYMGEMLYRQFKSLPNDKVEDKVALLQQLQGIYTQAGQMGSPEWAVASIWRLATAFQHIADVVEATPMPDGLSAAEVQQFRKAVKDQVEPLKQSSEQAFTTCITRAEQLEVFSNAVLGCRTKSDNVRSPLPNPPPQAAANVEELQKKVEGSQDAASMEALGLAYLQSGQLSLANLTLSRATEIEDNRASAHSALGWAMLLQGDPLGARAEYGKALDNDPTYEKARANLAALKCRFGDREGAKRDMSVIKEVQALAGPDVDPDWKACR